MSKRTAPDSMDYERSEFEHSLLASARSDGPTPAEVERAWLAFEADACALAPLLPALGARHEAIPRAAPSAPRPWSATLRVRALKWLLIGAVGGGSLVALWPSRGASPVPPPLPVAVPGGAGTPEPLAPIEIPSGAEPGPQAPAAAATRAETAVPTQRRAPGPVPASPSLRRTELPPLRSGMTQESRLTREVAALDAARAALAIGGSARALRQIEAYHREFPGGALEADADVVAIEALAAEGDQVALARAVQRFLRLRPRDPHVARIREIEAAALERRAAPNR